MNEMNCGYVDHPEGGLWPDMTDLVRVVRVYTDLEEELKSALQDIAGTILVVHPNSSNSDNGWIEEKDVVALRQTARDVLEKHKIVY